LHFHMCSDFKSLMLPSVMFFEKSDKKKKEFAPFSLFKCRGKQQR
jgi:hypothetical protein